LAHTDSAGLLERAEQLSGLNTSLAGVISGSRGATVLVTGEAGIGKTTLLRHFANRAAGSARFIWTACDPLFTPRPLGPLLGLAGSASRGLARQVVSGGKAFDVAATLLTELRRAGPTVMVIEDLHWADEATLDVARLLARRIDSVPVLLVLSYRDDELHRAHPLRVVVGELPGNGRKVTRIALAGLSRSAVAEIAGAAAVDATELHERTAGNPFFVTEVLAGDARQIPHVVRDAVLARAARLSGPALDLLAAAAVVPGHLDDWMLAALHPVPHGNLHASLDECMDSGILTACDGRVAFRHEIARQVIEESLPRGHRTRLHARALSVLQGNEDTAPDWARMTHHAEAAGDHAAVLRYAPIAARTAAAAGAHRSAADLYARALRFAGRLAPEERAQLLEEFAGEAYLTALGNDAVGSLTEALDIHRSAHDMLAEGRTLRQIARHLLRNGRLAEALATAEQAVSVLEQLPPHPELALAYVLLSGCYAMVARLPDAISWSEKAIRLGEDLGCPQAVYGGLNNIGTVEILRGDLAGVQKLERGRDLAERAGNSLGVGRAYLHLCWMLALRREWDLVARYLPKAIDYCCERGQELWLDQLRSLQLEAHLAAGRWQEAAEAAATVVAKPSPSSPVSRCGALLVLARVRARRGEPDYWPLLDEALRLTKLATVRHLTAPVAAARAEAAWLEGRLADVITETEQARRPAAGMDPLAALDVRCWRWRAGASDDGVSVGACDDAPEPYRMLLGGDRHAAARWWQEKGSPYEAALALSGSGDVPALRAATETLRGLGARAAAAVLVRELRALGERAAPRESRIAVAGQPVSLTQREGEVLRLLTAGMRNAEIAGHLFVSPRTVDHHVSALLAKLHARTRSEAVAAAIRLGLVQT
jgi:DNA-binding CsgD family transcriptional regulator/tetratricopeptide (TPR) repeat protein